MNEDSQPLATLDIRQMRQRIKQAAYREKKIDGSDVDRYGVSMVATLIRTAYSIAEVEGLSGEDAMTMLAYHALLKYEKAMDQLLTLHFLSPPPMYPIDPSQKNEKTK